VGTKSAPPPALFLLAPNLISKKSLFASAVAHTHTYAKIVDSVAYNLFLFAATQVLNQGD
jgi:hypothetical protein